MSLPDDHIAHSVAHLMGVVTDQEVADELARRHGMVLELTLIGTWRRAMGIPARPRHPHAQRAWTPEELALWQRLYRAHVEGVPVRTLAEGHGRSKDTIRAAFARLKREGLT